MHIKLAEFIISNSVIKYCPDEYIPEYAFIGRSNVGKSSLINMLVQQKGLAKTSRTPGKTQLVNHFKINNEWFLVDLPGYGYARVSKTSRTKFQKIITSYFEKRKQLVNTFVLIDIRHNPQPIDLDFMQWLGENGQPFSIIFTKSDKLKPKAITLRVEDYSKKMLDSFWEEMPPYFVSSAKNGMGREDILGYIEKINSSIIKI